MLVEAYFKASSVQSSSPVFWTNSEENASTVTDKSGIHKLFTLVQNPYEEGTEEQDRKYFRRAPDDAILAGGTAFMPWSS